jgi:hypothetical protein
VRSPLSGVCSAHTAIFLLRSCSSASVWSSGCFRTQGLVFPVDFWFWFYNLTRPDFLCLSHIFVYAARVLCASPFFIAKVSRSGIPVPASRALRRSVSPVRFSVVILIQPEQAPGGLCSFLRLGSQSPQSDCFLGPICSSKATPLFAIEFHALVLIGTKPFPNSVSADFSVRSGEPMHRPRARALGLGLHDRLSVQIQLLCLRSAFGHEFQL